MLGSLAAGVLVQNRVVAERKCRPSYVNAMMALRSMKAFVMVTNPHPPKLAILKRVKWTIGSLQDLALAPFHVAAEHKRKLFRVRIKTARLSMLLIVRNRPPPLRKRVTCRSA